MSSLTPLPSSFFLGTSLTLEAVANGDLSLTSTSNGSFSVALSYDANGESLHSFANGESLFPFASNGSFSVALRSDANGESLRSFANGEFLFPSTPNVTTMIELGSCSSSPEESNLTPVIATAASVERAVKKGKRSRWKPANQLFTYSIPRSRSPKNHDLAAKIRELVANGRFQFGKHPTSRLYDRTSGAFITQEDAIDTIKHGNHNFSIEKPKAENHPTFEESTACAFERGDIRVWVGVDSTKFCPPKAVVTTVIKPFEL